MVEKEGTQTLTGSCGCTNSRLTLGTDTERVEECLDQRSLGKSSWLCCWRGSRARKREKDHKEKPCVVAHTFNLSAQEAEAGGAL